MAIVMKLDQLLSIYSKNPTNYLMIF